MSAIAYNIDQLIGDLDTMINSTGQLAAFRESLAQTKECLIMLRRKLMTESRQQTFAHEQKIGDFAFAKFTEDSIIVVNPNMRPVIINNRGEVGTVTFEAVR